MGSSRRKGTDMNTTRKYRVWGLLMLGVQLVRCQSEYTGQGGTSLAASGWQDPSLYSYESQQQVATAVPRQDLLANPALLAVGALGAVGLVGASIMMGQVNEVRNK